ncbi:DNA-binding response regulator [Lysinibacillus sp. PLM2]|nr:DNA-binding response regulator [Lysinibacillus sp. PLM2]
MIKILIVDDHPIVLEGTKNLFQDIEDILVDTSDDIYAIHQMLEESQNPYDLYLIDINMPEQNGIVLCSKVRTTQPNAKIILYTGDNIEDYYSLILEKMVHGLLSKTSTKEQMIRAIRATIAGDLVLPANFINYIKDFYNANQIEETLKLNEREKQILHYISKGYTNSAIAIELQVTQRTIERNLSQIFNLLNVASRTEAVLAAKEKNLI